MLWITMTRVISSHTRWKRTRINTKMTLSFLRGNQMILSHTRIIPLIQVWRGDGLRTSMITCWIPTPKSKALTIFGPLPSDAVKRTNSATGRIWVRRRTDPTRSSAFLAMMGSRARRGYIKSTRPPIYRKFPTSLIASNIDWVTSSTLVRA